MRSTGGNDPYPMVDGGRTLAHEIGHRFGSDHVLCKGNEGPPNGSIDPDYPHPAPDCRITPFDANGYYGLDVYWKIWDPAGDPTVLDNGDPNAIAALPTIFPLMGYNNPRWTSPYTYCGYLNDLVVEPGFSCNQDTIDPKQAQLVLNTASAADTSQHTHTDGNLHLHAATSLPAGAFFDIDPAIAALNDAATLLLVTGIVDLDNDDGQLVRVAIEERENVFDHVVGDAEITLKLLATTPLSTDFRLEIRDANDQVLVEQALAPDVSFHEGIPGFSFNNALPLPDDATKVALMLNDQLIDERSLLGEGPTVALLAPGDGSIDPGDSVQWIGNDPDGDPLLFTLKYSPDGGQTWQVLALDTTETEFDFQFLRELAGSERALLRVVASDGVRNARATSDLLVLADSPPELIVTNPAPDSTFTLEEAVLLSGFGQDPEDGFLPDVVWTSNLDGDLGTGDIGLTGLRPGLHTVTAKVKDSAGNVATTELQFTVAGAGTDTGTRSIALVDGWNLAMWTGATPIEAAVADIAAALDAVFAFDAAFQAFSQYRPNAPAVLNTLAEVSLGEGLWLRIDDPDSAVWTQPDFTGARSVALDAGFNLVGWTGGDLSIEEAVADIINDVESVLLWDPVAEAFLTFSPDLPAALNTVFTLEHGDGLWIRLSQAVVWDQPAP